MFLAEGATQAVFGYALGGWQSPGAFSRGGNTSKRDGKRVCVGCGQTRAESVSDANSLSIVGADGSTTSAL